MSRTIAIVGNPNSGKTTLFNGLTGGNLRVGNWPGVTVEKRSGTIPLYAPSLAMVTGRASRATSETEPPVEAPADLPGNPELIDLPGIYSLNASSEDEIVARDVLLKGEYDLVINVVDASNLERNLFLTLQLIEMRVPLLVVLNMMDIATAHGIEIDAEHLAHHLGCPVVATSADRRDGIATVRAALADHLETSTVSVARITYPEPVAAVVDRWQVIISEANVDLACAPTYTAVRLLEGDPWVARLVDARGALTQAAIESERAALASRLHEDLDIVIADARYGFIHGLAHDVIRRTATRESVTERIDQVVMNRWLGIPLFLAAMYLVFWATVAVGGAFIDFFDIAFGTIFVDGVGALLDLTGAPAWLHGILADGVGAGIQTVATFVPIIFMMFFMLSLLEDSGYMARAAFVMDRLMRWLGLPGKSFVPLLVGFGCTVPAISATRTLESRKDRFTTIFMAPFMSCGARLPVYALFAAALFPARTGQIVFAVYMIGLVLAIATGLLLKHTVFRGRYSHFVMELPPYHAPRLGAILRLSWLRLAEFVKRAGITITIVVALLAVLNSVGTDGSFGNEESDRSVLAAIGRSITPIFTPMGIERDNWPATVGLFTGMFAKEAIVGTLSALYSQNADDDEGEPFDLWGGLGEALASVPAGLAGIVGALGDPLGAGIVTSDADGLADELAVDDSLFARMRSMFSPGAAFAYLVFVLIYFPCVAALGAAVQEMGAGYATLLAVYLTVLAWIVGVAIYQVSVGEIGFALAVAGGGLATIGAGFALLGALTRPIDGAEPS